jgi:hypothetical protein
MSESDPGAALPSRVQECAAILAEILPEGMTWTAALLELFDRREYAIIEAESKALTDAPLLLRDLASALQQREATCEALSNLCADRQAHLAAVSSALQQAQADLKAAEIVIEASERSEHELSGRLDRQIRDYKIIAAKLDTAEAAHQRLRGNGAGMRR